MTAPTTRHDEAIGVLLRAVAAAMAVTAPPPSAATAQQLEAYVGDVIDVTFSGGDDERIELLARLLTLARAATAARDRDLLPYAWLRRLERPLRRWERDRRLGTASPRPRPADLDARMAMLPAAVGPDAVIGVETVAVAVAELVAVHQLAGTTSIEEGLAVRAAIEPLVQEAAGLLRERNVDVGHGVFAQAGATLAHVDQAAWQVEQILRHPQGDEELRWLRTLWTEIAAALVFAQDLHARRDDHVERWRAVHDLAAEKLSVGELLHDASGFDERATLGLVRSGALELAALWLDEERSGVDRQLGSVPLLEGRLLAGAAQSLVAAWVAERRMGAPPMAQRLF